jgi:MFS family permease
VANIPVAAGNTLLAPVNQVALQSRVVKVLAAGQILGGIGVASGASVGAILAADLAGDSFSGLAAASSNIGAAIVALPVARLMSDRGRRPGLLLAYIVGILGCLMIIVGTQAHFFPIALLGLFLFGGGTTATLQSRYAATDLARPENRGRSLGTVVWATTFGSVLGPNLSGPTGNFAETVNLPRLAGPYLMSITVFIVAYGVIWMFLRPDPLITAKALQKDGVTHPRLRFQESLRVIRAHPTAILGLASMVLGHMVMVAVMSMTPVHLDHAGASLQVIGFVISGHITGMYVASPLVGWATDRYGRKLVIVAGGAILLLSFLIAGSAPDSSHVQLGIGLFLLGLGWSCTLIAGSTLLTESVPFSTKPSVQGAADLTMGIAGATAGLLAGLVVGLTSYAVLTIVSTCLILPLLAGTIKTPKRVPQVT